MGIAGTEVGIRQSIYVPIERETAYGGVLFAFASEGAVTLTVSFRRHDAPDDILVSTRFDVAEQGRWVKLPFTLKLPVGAVEPLRPVDFAVAVESGGRVSLDEIRLYPADAVDGLDPEAIQLAQKLKTPLLRYGGNFSSGYHWEDGVGPLDQRPTRLNEAWGTPEYNEFGTNEFMDLCDRIGALPQICLNLGSGTLRKLEGGSNILRARRSLCRGNEEQRMAIPRRGKSAHGSWGTSYTMTPNWGGTRRERTRTGI